MVSTRILIEPAGLFSSRSRKEKKGVPELSMIPSMAEKINPSYVSRVLRLTLLAPDIVEAILDGRRPPQTTLALLLNPFPIVWEDQRAGLLGQSSVPLARRLR